MTDDETLIGYVRLSLTDAWVPVYDHSPEFYRYRSSLFTGDVQAPETDAQHAARLARDAALETPDSPDMLSDAYIRANMLRLRMDEIYQRYSEGVEVPDEEFLRVGYSQQDMDELHAFREYWVEGSWFQKNVEPPELGLNMTVLIKAD